MDHQCWSSPCNHQGKCVEGWNRFICDCRATGFAGSICQTATVTLRFNGTQFMKVTLATQLITQADDISLRFRTKHPTGLLFVATGGQGSRMELHLENGILYLSLNSSAGSKVLSTGQALHDNLWHTVFITRRLQVVELTIDQEKSISEYLPGQIKELSFLHIEVGHLARPDFGPGNSHLGFVGAMQSFMFNSKDLFQIVKSDLKDKIEISAHFSADEHTVLKPVTFKSAETYAVLSQLQFDDKLAVTLQLRTTEPSGLILYYGGVGPGFFALELFQGSLFYVYELGGGPQRLKVNVSHALNDNKWHEVFLLRTKTYKHLLRVDGSPPTMDDLTNVRNNKFDPSGLLYIGGVSKKMYPFFPKLIYSRHGFVGCLGSLDVNGYMPDLIQDANPVHGNIEYGCQGPVVRCAAHSCANNGRCIQHWTSYKCDCDMTSFTGPACKDEGVSYKFGPGPGLMTFMYAEGQQPSTSHDSLAFGFQTFQDEATLIRIDSKTIDDFIHMELMKGHVHVTYNMGSVKHHVADVHEHVNNGRYHIVRFTRSGSNATLQVDTNTPQVKNPTGQQSHIFNNQASVRVGGRKVNGSITDHFEGLISGLVLNGIHLFELAKRKDKKIQSEGSVSLNVKVAPARFKDLPADEVIDEMQSTEGDPAVKEGVTDDIIFAGVGSGCQLDDEEDCSAVMSGTDEIITAVVIIKTTTTQPTTTTTTATVKQPHKCSGPDCDASSKLRHLPDLSTSVSQKNGGGLVEGDGHFNQDNKEKIYSSQHKIHDEVSVDVSTEEPDQAAGKAAGSEDGGVNLGLILGVSGSVLVAVIVLCIALWKLRSRDEGTYKVDETQNFSSLSRKSVGNGAAASGSEAGSCSRGKKKDVKEWYV